VSLAVLLETTGSTYSKSGAMLLMTRDGTYAGLLSGGCLELDLCEHARTVIDDGCAREVRYDTREPHDLVFGLGSGCEGMMRILVIRVGPEERWEPLARFQAAHDAHQATAVGFVVEPLVTSAARGGREVRSTTMLIGTDPVFDALLRGALNMGTPSWTESPHGRVFAIAVTPPPRILILGAGPDAQPLAALAMIQGWKVTIYDFRTALADLSRFPGAERVVHGRPEEVAMNVELDNFNGAVIMSHHLEADAAYVKALASSNIGYVGLLGPAPRRDRLRSQLSAEFGRLGGRLHAPAGFALGSRGPESIALGIVAEIHVWLHGHDYPRLTELGAAGAQTVS